MKALSMKLKITIGYTITLILFVIGVLFVIVEIADDAILINEKEQLVDEVSDAIQDIQKGKKFDYFDDNVYLILYNDKKEYIDGGIPEFFPVDSELYNGKLRKIKTNDDIVYYVYDRSIVVENGETMWLRGVISDMNYGKMGRFILHIAFIILPILIVISTIIAYFITGKALEPVKKIQETAENISQNNRLSLRIGLKGTDEIGKLAKTIDNMLEKLENAFVKEKRFTSDVAHELRTPISIIMAESEYNIKHEDQLSEMKESMKTINKQIGKMSSIVEQLLTLSRADYGNVKLNLKYIDVEKKIFEVIESIQEKANKKGIKIQLNSNLDNKIFKLDELMFERVIHNIIENGIKYGIENGYVKIVLSLDKDRLKIVFEDNGIGISNENIDKIWDRFYVVDKSRSLNRDSTGLGLSMVKLIVEKHQGNVKVSSKLGVGTTFTIFFKNL